jgi:general secretion pathway protein F
MPVFAYRALTAAGEDRRGVVDAESARAAWQAIRARGVYPTEVRAEGSAPASRRRVPAGARAAALRTVATLLDAGLPATDALAAAAEHAGHPALADALVVAATRVREGAPVADALAARPAVFSDLVTALARAGEASGALATVLGRIAAHEERTAAVAARLRAALTYPAVMLATSAAVLAVLVVWVVPQMAALFVETGAALPLPTRVLLAVAGAVRDGWWVLAVVLLAVGAAAARLGARPEGRTWRDRALLRLPVAGPLVRDAIVARVGATMATLLASGLPLDEALRVAADAAGNGAVADALRAARTAVREGRALAPALAAAGVCPPLAVQLVAVGERSGALGPAFARAAAACEADVDAGLAATLALVEPVAVLAMGGAVLLLVLTVLVPLLELGTLVQ